MRNWLKTALFLSAMLPSLISVALARVLQQGWSWDVLYYAVPGALGIFLVWYILDVIRNHGENFSITLKKVESNDAMMLGVVVTYFLPFLAKAIDITMSTVLMLLALGAVVFWFSSSILPNPILRLFRYRFYKAETATGVVYTLITKRDLIDPTHVKSVKRISGSMLVEIT